MPASPRAAGDDAGQAIRRVLAAHKVQTADGGVDALALFAAHPFDLVLYDVETADLSAADMYQHLREFGLERRLVTMAGARGATLAKLVAEAAIPCVDKPFDAGEIDLLLATRPGR
ncbi:MAG TPA: hypothetical protein VH560_06525 [Polyangia bacterium]|jgi:DNA-binding response OmpR family regulator|nr:hypothetical protein [Polyangia bacterium]